MTTYWQQLAALTAERDRAVAAAIHADARTDQTIELVREAIEHARVSSARWYRLSNRLQRRLDDARTKAERLKGRINAKRGTADRLFEETLRFQEWFDRGLDEYIDLQEENEGLRAEIETLRQEAGERKERADAHRREHVCRRKKVAKPKRAPRKAGGGTRVSKGEVKKARGKVAVKITAAGERPKRAGANY